MQIALLGEVRVTVGGRDVPLGPRQRRLMFAVLAWQVNQVVPLARIEELVWPDSPPRRAAHAIQVGVSDLRTRLAGLGVELETHGAGYLLRADPLLVDVHRFTALVAKAGLADDEERVGLLGEALRLWRGPALADTAEDATRQRLCAGAEETRLVAIEDRAAALLRLGRHEDVIDELTELAAEHPARERLVGCLARALADGGQAGEAQEVLRRTRNWLADELGMDPGTEFRQLEAELRLPSMLPPVTGFSGRDKDIAKLDAATGGDGLAVRIGAIVGTAGVGKTALASHWAHLRRDRFPDGQLYLDMRGYSSDPPLSAEQALLRFLRVLGVPPTELPTDLTDATGMFRTRLTGKRILVVLDNVAGVDQVRPLIPNDPGCVVVVTSRERLDGLVARDGAIRVPLDVLTADESDALLRKALGNRADPALALACAHLPLALRMAAAHLVYNPQKTVDAYIAELRSADGIEGAVRTAFDLSYGALKPQYQRLFRLLGLLPGPDVTAEAAAVLADCDAPEAARLLDQLAAAHLLTQHVQGRRYFLHDLLSRYARERSVAEESPDERAAAVDRLTRFYLQTVSDAVELLYPYMLRLPRDSQQPSRFTEWAKAQAWLNAERANLVAAAVHGPRPTSWLLADALRGYFYQTREFTDWFSVAGAGLVASTEDGDLRGQAAMNFSLALANQARNDYQPATEHYLSSLRLSEAAGWGAGEASAFINLGLIDEVRGDLRQAAERYTQGRERSSRAGARQLEAATLVNLGAVHAQLGRLIDAERSLFAALEINRELGSRQGEADARYYLGAVAGLRGRFDDAEAQVTAVLAYYREIGRIQDEAESLALLARIRCEAGRHAEAAADARGAIELARRTGDQHTECGGHVALANALRGAGAVEEAAAEFDRALVMADVVDAAYLTCTALIGSAETRHDLGEHDRAVAEAVQARDMARAAGYRLLEGMALAAARDDAAAAVFAETGYLRG
ncbi:AfsR/SARP family transcriptional regulator [Kutzneria chonburiensis]|uniref:BTAD domain-containing putative transcriptional regulator n=1 Tax=Kutzneria chonburiensis TaxID=1483604 RepID=A0ABV6N095_9PSEU|nr:BTAD domain-containing putative transcriptional regulator [Kutzneria chonburiensis]